VAFVGAAELCPENHCTWHKALEININSYRLDIN